MATAGGTPPAGVTPKPKREFTPLQKFGLPAIAGMALIVAYMYWPRSRPPVSPPSGVTPSATPATPAKAPNPPTASPATLGVVSTGAVPGGAQVVPAVFVSRARTDPFQQALLYPPVPTPPPPPPPKPKPPLPPVALPSPGSFSSSVTPISVPDPRMRAELAEPLNLGGPRIVRTTEGAPRDAAPLPRTTGGDTGGEEPQQSYDKRLAGVLIGDGVRALLEITSGDQITTQVVQPGDEVNGIRILNIERSRNGDRTVTRMLVRDTDGTQRIVELKPAPQAAAGAGGPGGATGAPGGIR